MQNLTRSIIAIAGLMIAGSAAADTFTGTGNISASCVPVRRDMGNTF